MNIYFVNKKSCIVGPFDITDAHHKKIIKIGDVIIRDSTNGISFLLVISDANRWNVCKCLGKANGQIGIESNTLLFRFDGVSQRFGNIKKTERLRELFNTSPISDFFDNALSILSYKCDFWDMNIFCMIHLLTPIEFQQLPNKKQTRVTVCNKSTGYLFEEYLDAEMLLLFESNSKQNKPLRDVYKEIRNRYPMNFRQALKLFLKDNPNSTIYDKI